MLSQNQCEWGVSFWTLLSLAAHFASLFFRGTGKPDKVGSAVCGVLAALGICVTSRGVEMLYYMHQVVGMVAFEVAAQSISSPMIMVTSRSAVGILFSLIIPNIFVVAGEITGKNLKSWSLNSPYWQWFLDVGLYKKHHALLHSLVCIMLLSASLSYIPRWRHSFRIQLTRMFLEPTCIMSIAWLLFTHSHTIGDNATVGTHSRTPRVLEAITNTRTQTHDHAGANDSKLQTHPTIATMIMLATATQFIMMAAHIPHAPLRRGLPDLAKLQPRGPPSLLVWRLVSAFMWLMLAHFLYIDYYFEYLGCRADFFGEPGSRRSIGHTLGSELGQYIACSLILAVGVLVTMIFTQLSGLAAAEGKDYTPFGQGGSEQSQEDPVHIESSHGRASALEVCELADLKSI